MKTSTKLMLAAVLSASFVGTASANTDVYLTGSSAFRASDTNGILNLFGGSGKAIYDGTKGLSGATHQVIEGTYNGTTYDVHTCWTGSLSGLIAINFHGSALTAFFTTANLTAHGSTATAAAAPLSASSVITGGTQDTTDTPVNNASDGAFSDVFASSTPYNGSVTSALGTDGIVGIVPFVFVGNPDLKAAVTAGHNISNVSAVQAKQLYAGGVAVPQFTGVDADATTYPFLVLPVGRDADSGTRFTTFAESGFNPVGAAQNPPTQYAVSTSGTSVLVDEYPAETLFAGSPQATSFALGAGGYPSGGNEQSALNVPGTSGANSDNQSFIIGSLGESDAKNAVANTGASAANNGYFLSYNGQSYGTVTYTTSGSTVTAAAVSYNRTALEEGLYTFWSYEHCYFYSSAGTPQQTFIKALASEVRTTDAPIAGDTIANMAVQRDYEGGPISYVGVGQSTK